MDALDRLSRFLSGMERAGKKNGNNKDRQFWQQHNKPLEITDQQMFETTLKYIHDNPLIAGFVNKAADWKYSSARDLCVMKGLVELSLVSIQCHRYPLHKAKLHTCASGG